MSSLTLNEVREGHQVRSDEGKQHGGVQSTVVCDAPGKGERLAPGFVCRFEVFVLSGFGFRHLAEAYPR